METPVQIEGCVIDDPIRIDWPSRDGFLYGLIYGFAGNSYLVGCKFDNSGRSVARLYCSVPDSIELLLYF